MGQNLKRAGQFYRDIVNGDLLKIINFTFEIDPAGTVLDVFNDDMPGTEYVRCACIVNGSYFGIQEMKTSHLDNAERFLRVPRLISVWLRWKYRDSKLTVPMRDVTKPQIEPKNTY